MEPLPPPDKQNSPPAHKGGAGAANPKPPTKETLKLQPKFDPFFAKAADIVGKGYAKIAEDSVNTVDRSIMELLDHRALPEHPWDEITVSVLMQKIAMMDSNNYKGNTGVGEREGRIFSPIVR